MAYSNLSNYPESHARSFPEVNVIGLGYVGLTLSVFLADLGFRVHGIEIRKLVLDCLDNDQSFFWEPMINEKIRKTRRNGNFSYSDNFLPPQGPRVHVITVGTPIDSNKAIKLDAITKVAHQLAENLVENDLVILRSTVKVGTTEELIKPILDNAGKKYSLAYCPERTLEGSALKELGVLPQIVGGIDFDSTKIAADFFRGITSTVVQVSNSRTAEMIKLVDNMQRDVHFGISNEISRMCNSTSIRASEVIQAGKLGYPRTNLSIPGPVGGPCLEKDSYILAESFIGKVDASIALVARKTNELVVLEVCEFIEFWIKEYQVNKPASVAILGMAFKGIPETDDLRGSTSVSIYERLSRSEFVRDIFCWDPVIDVDTLKNLGYHSTGINKILRSCDVFIFANNHPKLEQIPLTEIPRSSKKKLIYDLWNRFEHSESIEHGLTFSSWGSHGSYH